MINSKSEINLGFIIGYAGLHLEHDMIKYNQSHVLQFEHFFFLGN